MDANVFTITGASLSPSDTVPNNNTTTSRPHSSRGTSIFHPTRLSSISPPQRPPEKPCSAQNRRLQLRNAGFRGSLLQSRKITPPFTRWRSLSGASDQHLEKQIDDTASIDQSCNLSKPTTSHTRRSSILEEINNSTQRRYRQSPRPPAASLFHDLPSPDPPTSANDSPLYSPSKCSGQLGPPIDLDTFDYSDTDMPSKSRKPSWRSSPFSSLDRPKRRPNITNRNSDLELSRYIEHLEEQLSASLNRVESIDSSTTNIQAAKFKALNAEYKILKQELLEWETKFETRLKDELRNTIDKESELRAKIRSLERLVEIKENKIHEQQWEIEMATQKLQNMEAVNATNRSLERRIDVLTELLAQSPTRMEPSSGLNLVPETSSPQADGIYHTPRPRSMFSKIPLSPVRKALFQPLSVPTSNITPDFPVHYHPAADHSYASPPQRFEETDDAELMSLDSGVGDSCSPPSTRAPDSQRSSMISHSSSNPSHWGTSFPLSPEIQGKYSSRHRRMRRFPPGSCTLKPLILPATSPHVPASRMHRHSFSNDPISPFHLRPTSAHYSPNSPWVEPDTLRALEGQSHRYQTFDEAINGHSLSGGIAPLETDLDDHSTTGSSPHIFFDDVHPSTLMESPAYDSQAQNEPLKRVTPCTLESELRQSNSSMRVRPRTNREIDRDITPMAVLDSKIARLRKIYPAPRNYVPLNGRQDPFYYIWDAAPNPVNLIRRIIANAWHANWNRLGKLSWWVLGLFLGGQPRNQWLKNKRQCRINYDNNDDTASTTNPRSPTNSYHSGTHYRSSHREETPTKQTTMISPDDTSTLIHTPLRGSTKAHPISITAEPPPKRQLEVWARFSFALVLAIGLAVRDGPASLMDECLLRGSCITDGTRPASADTDENARPPSERSSHLLEASPPPPLDFSHRAPSGDQVNGEPEILPVHIPPLHPDIPPG
ncbi:hypothetical protein EMPG_12370 [Blastomyces silverae]|uniref:Uncharacterized protein n=1 Tax=Blastomyces silverae TaxID=2060906 RepID=A0A0H1BM40_9EURO|nr:hypothetical protein EMPG_12370 [Blastomyces silverae]